MDSKTKEIAMKKFSSLTAYQAWATEWDETVEKKKQGLRKGMHFVSKRKIFKEKRSTERARLIKRDILAGAVNSKIVSKYGVTRQYSQKVRTELREEGYRV